MNLHKWLKRKYTNHSYWLISNYDKNRLEYLKWRKCDVGILKEDNGKNKKGDLVIFKRCKEMIEENENGYEYPNKGGWTGGFEYYYYFAKESGMLYNRCYTKLVEDLK